MRSVLVCLLLASCFALLRAEDEMDDMMGEMLMEDEYMQKCKEQLRRCMNRTSDAAFRNKCYEAYWKCMSDNRPKPSYRPRPSRPKPTLPPFAQKCKEQLRRCMNRTSDAAVRNKCYEAYRKCMSDNRPKPSYRPRPSRPKPTLPPFAQKCKEQLRRCMNRTSDAAVRNKCYEAYRKCMSDNRPKPSYRPRPSRPKPTLPPFAQKCKEQLRRCMNRTSDAAFGNKCYEAYRKCMSDNRPKPSYRPRPSRPKPTLPPFAKKCKEQLRRCMNRTSDAAVRNKCYEAYRKCMSDSRPKPSCRPSPTIPAQVEKCRMELKVCLNGSSGGFDRLKCFNAFGKCIFENNKPVGDEELEDFDDAARLSLPAFAKKCMDTAAVCRKNAGKDWNKRWACRRAFVKCIKDSKPDSDEV
ncbi:uncharacterized protein LOC5515691 isoform X2 [Nematostella vectensis]|uniref:uncharacterized protein LOC5515691 isoform X2 n=1 Tax=Nematostella vectensis TaxID=45351 RepID=UPI0020778235|nr:uncharacterized protein LOC5515691 isoform X2 [Nematostella vectensis]